MLSFAANHYRQSRGRYMQYCSIKRMIAVLLPMALLAGCASTPKLGGDPNLKIIQASELPAPDRMDLTADARDYFVGPFDKLTIDVFGMPELTQRDVQVDAGGRISFPLAGVVKVSGKTPGEIETLLAGQMRANYVREPQVTVNLKETMSQLLTVEGQVTKPGVYPVLGRMSLLRAMAVAGGTTEFSKLSDVVIFRTVGGERLAAMYDLDAIRHGAYADPEVFANDVVMVGDSASRRLFKDILAVVPLITTPLVIGLDRLAN
jgi:polysaccharide export outer membrane protein